MPKTVPSRTRDDAAYEEAGVDQVSRESDEEAMARFSAGAEDAFGELFSRYRQPMYGFFRRRVVDRADAEELTQETFLALFRARTRYEPVALFRTYLYAIALNLLRAHRRKAGARAIAIRDAAGEDELAARNTMDAEVVLREALGQLSETEREIVLLREFEQMSYAEMAELLGLPLNTVRSRLLRARLALRIAERSGDAGHGQGREGASMTTNVHAVASEEVMAFLDGELPASAALAVSEHMAGCAECAALAEDVRAGSRSLAEWQVEEVAARVEEDVWKVVGTVGGKAELVGRDWSRLRWWAGGLAIAAGLGVVMVLLPGPKPTEFVASSGGVSAGADRIVEARQPLSKAEMTAAPRTMAPAAAGVAGMASGGVIGGIAGAAKYEPLAAPLPARVATSSIAQATVQATPGPMIARSVSMTMEVKDVEVARAAVEGILGRHHGYAATLNVYTAERTPRRVQASLRVPATELAGTLAELKALGRVENETQAGEEIGEQHADLEARLKTARATEESFRGILRQRTGTVSDVMNVQEGIERVRGEIERMETEQSGLEHRVAFASVDLAMAEHEAARVDLVGDSISVRIHRALVAGYENLTESLIAFLLWVIEYGPVLVVWTLVWGHR